MGTDRFGYYPDQGMTTGDSKTATGRPTVLGIQVPARYMNPRAPEAPHSTRGFRAWRIPPVAEQRLVCDVPSV